jgi:hypothetical protein
MRDVENGWVDNHGTGKFPLLTAVSTGNLSDVEQVLETWPNLEASNESGLTALQIALKRGDEEIVDALIKAGAALGRQRVDDPPMMFHAIDSGRLSLVKRLVQEGCDIDEKNLEGYNSLDYSALLGHHEIIAYILDLEDLKSSSEPIEDWSEIADSVALRRFIRLGADPGELSHEARHLICGFGEIQWEKLITDVTREQYSAFAYSCAGRENPEDMSNPFWTAMVRNGLPAHLPRDFFNDELQYENGMCKSEQPAVWCANRWGQSWNLLPDGRSVLIGGYHEDGGFPDFCIYNDVIIVSEELDVQIYGYPFEVFPPVDRHTATRIGSDIWIIGGIRYQGQNERQIPVYRLALHDFSMERVATFGQAPGQIYGHTAQFVRNGIEISGGRFIRETSSQQIVIQNNQKYRLDIESLHWTEIKTCSA